MSRAGGYTAMQILEAVATKAGSFNPENVRNAYASITVQTVRGLWRANKQGLSTIDGLAIQIQNGKRVLVWPAHVAEGKFLPMPKWEDRDKK